MTEPNSDTPTFGGRPLHELLVGELPRFTDHVSAEITHRIPVYREVPRGRGAAGLRSVIEATMLSFAESLRTGVFPDADSVGFARDAAAHRAAAGIPLDVVLSAYHVGLRALWDCIIAEVGSVDVDDVLAANTLALRYLEVLSPAVGAAYAQCGRGTGSGAIAQRNLVEALLAGTGTEEWAAAAGIHLPERFCVVTVLTRSHPPGVFDLVRSRVSRRCPGPVLSRTAPGRGILLVAHPHGASAPSDRIRGAVRAAAAEHGVVAGIAVVDAGEVPVAAELSYDVASAAWVAARPPGVYALDDVLLEYQLARPSAAARRLVTLLAPLEDSSVLLDTLREFLWRGGRRPAADALHVHPNTVDYRLHRVQQLTGLDPTDLRAGFLLYAALVASEHPGP